MLDSPGLKSAIRPQGKVWRTAVETADVVIAGNEYLAELSEPLNSNTIVIPSCIEPRDYKKKRDYSINLRPKAVWIGSPSSEKYISSISEPLNLLHQQLGLRLVVISSGSSEITGVNPEMIERKNWSLPTFADDLAAADFGIMPLEATDWEKGKCAYKLLQYAATGLPTVASPVGANKTALSTISGLPASTRDDWIEGITALTHMSSSDRSAIGANAVKGVVERYSFASWRSTWLRAVGLES